MSVRRAQQEIGSAEFAEWIAYYNLEPWGEERADLRAGIVSHVIANVNRGKGQRPYKPHDFMPEFDRQQVRQQSPAQMKAILRAAGAAAGQAAKTKKRGPRLQQ